MKNNLKLVLMLACALWKLSVYGQNVSTQTKPINLEQLNESVLFCTSRFNLELASNNAKPSCLRLKNGKQVLQPNDENGILLSIPNQGDFYLNKMYKSGNNFVFTTQDEKFYATFEIEAKPHYIAFRLKDFYGDLPAGSTMAFIMAVDDKTKVLPFDYMTIDKSQAGNLTIYFEHLWERYKGNTLGGFALYTFSTPEEEDESILRAWGDEAMPHPKVAGTWNYERAVQWMEDWKTMFEDQSVFYISPNNVDELALFEPYFEMSDVTTVNLFTDIWHGGFWPYNRLNWEVDGIFGSKQALQSFSQSQRQKGRNINMHYVSGGIGKADPLYAKENLSDELASWVDGTLISDITEQSTTVYFHPKESWYKAPSSLSGETEIFGSLSQSLPSFFNYSYIQIGKELMKLGNITVLADGTWKFDIQVRGLNTTKQESHSKNSIVKGIILPYNAVYVPDNNSPLFETVATNWAKLLNDCKVSNALFDGAEIHEFDGKWGFRKFAQRVYENLDHPVVTRTSHGKEPDSGYIEYKLNMTKPYLTSPVGDHNHGRPSLRLERLSRTHKDKIRESSNLLAANFMLSTQVAVNGRNFSILRPDPMFGLSLEELQGYGKTEELLSLLPKWKKVNRKLTDEQRQIMLNTHTSYDNKIASKVTYELREQGDDYLLVPIQMMSHDPNDIQSELAEEPALQLFHAKQEDGMFVPRVKAIFGDTKNLENKYHVQVPHFQIRIMWGEENIVNPTLEMGGATLTVNTTITASATESQYIEYRGGNTAKVYDKNWNLKEEVSITVQGNFEAQEGYNQVTLSSTNNSLAEVELLLFTEGEPLRVEKIQDATLSDLAVNGVSVSDFSPLNYDYNFALPQGTTEVPTITATAYNKGDSVEIINADNFYGTTHIKVLSKDGQTVRNYEVKLDVLGRAFYKWDEGAYLTSFRTNKLTVTPNIVNPFPDELVGANEKVAKIVRGKAQNALMIFNLNGTFEDSGEKIFRVKVYQASGQAKYPRNNNIIFGVKNRQNLGPKHEDRITITQQDKWVEYIFDYSDRDFTQTTYDEILLFLGGGDVEETEGVEYYISVAEGPHINYNKDISLKSIEAMGVIDENIAPSITSCSLELPCGTTAVPTLNAIPNNESASVNVVNANNLSGKSIVTVTSQDGTTQKVYEVLFTVARDLTDATLSDLLINDLSLTDFEPSDIFYDVELPYGTISTPTVTAIPSNQYATVELIEASNFYGTTTIKVTAEDGITDQYYFVNFDVLGREFYKFDGNSSPVAFRTNGLTVVSGQTNPFPDEVVGADVKVAKVTRGAVGNALMVFNLNGSFMNQGDNIFRVKVYQASGQAKYPKSNNIVFSVKNRQNIGPKHEQLVSIKQQDKWVEYVFDFSGYDFTQTDYDEVLLFLGGGDTNYTEGVEYYVSVAEGPKVNDNNNLRVAEAEVELAENSSPDLRVYKSNANVLTVESSKYLAGKMMEIYDLNGSRIQKVKLSGKLQHTSISKKGLYFIHVYDAKGRSVHKVLF